MQVPRASPNSTVLPLFPGTLLFRMEVDVELRVATVSQATGHERDKMPKPEVGPPRAELKEAQVGSYESEEIDSDALHSSDDSEEDNDDEPGGGGGAHVVPPGPTPQPSPPTAAAAALPKPARSRKGRHRDGGSLYPYQHVMNE